MTPPAHALLAPAPCDDAVFRPADILFGEGDNAPRWREGERLEHLFEDMCDRLAAEGRADAPAVEVDGVPIGFDELDARANRLARHLIAEGVGPDDVVALLFDRSAETYVALLAVLKAGAAYVPLDPGFPRDRIAFICADAGARAALTVEHHLALLEDVPLPRIALDREAAAISQHPAARLTEAERGPQRGDLAYLIYTSGTTGRPKGVAIAHPSIVNFVRVAAETYGYRPGDRVYQGLTLAFDFSVEEIWVPLLAGATLVPNNGEVSLVGEDLWRFLDTRRITALCCVPTLLATVEDDLPQLRLVILSGEACPQDLARRWSREDRRILNAYGPTETTVTATLAVIEPGARVTIGRPLPSYIIAIFDPETGAALPRGETGEIMIGGIGLARGYLGRDELTAKAFVPDTLSLPHNPSGRLYRSGDLGRINEEGTIDYLGRIDTQVKIRGYRIELTEIESVLMQIPGIAQAVVEKFEPEPGQTELVAYYTEAGGTDAAQEGIMPDTVAAFLRERLPSYMVPAFYERLETMPMLPSDKADRKALPRPSGRRLNGGNAAFVAPGTPLEADLARLLARVLKLETLSVEDDFFNDLGASSLVMARFSALIRRETGISDFSMRDMYGAPSIRKLAALLEACSGGREPLRRAEDTHEPSYLAYYGCGLAQIGFAAAYALAMAAVLSRGLDWTLSAEGFVETYLRGTLALGAQFAVLCLAPVALKWLLIGRWQAEVIPAWSARYLRFWIVRTLTRAHPLAALPGTPLYSVFLRAMGAKIGAGALVQSAPPVCMDLIEIGPGAVVGRKALLQGYKAVDGRIVTGTVRIGTGAHVGEGAVLDIDTEIGDGAQLGHASSLMEGQKLEAGTRAHGSPAVHTATDFRRVGERGTPAPLRRTLYGAGQLATLLLIPPAILTLGLRLMALASANSSIDDLALHATTLQALPELLFYSSVLFFGGLVLGLAVVLVLPRMAWLFLEADRDYPLFGIRHFLLQVIDRSSNSRFFNLMFGDSVLITGYLRALGYRFGGLFQTGSNFGVQQRHDVPFLCSFGKGTMVSDNLTMANAEFSVTQFRLGHVRFGEDNFLGNTLIYPAGGRTGDNVLIGTKTMIPIDGPLRENTGLLGSPAFPIPRSVLRDKQFDAYTDETLRQERLALKTRYNLGTLGVFLLVRWGLIFGSLSVAHAVYFDTMLSGTAGIAVSGLAVALFALVYGIFCERAAFGFRRMSAQFCSIYDRYFWTHERFWKMNISSVLMMLDGTPFKAWALRALGVRVGRKLFDDGASMPEKTLVSIGDCCTLNHQATMQAHSLEDGAFKSDFIAIGNRVTLGVNAFVHYSARVGDNALIEADSFLMKGEAPAANSVWRGNPATEVQVPAPVVQLEDRRSAPMPHMAAALSPAGSAAVVAAE